MAVFYKWLKGCANGASLTEKQWSYITWGNSTKVEGEGDSATESLVKTSTNIMPTLKASVGRIDSPTEDLGYFLTNKMPAPLIQTDWRTTKTFYFINPNYTAENEDFSQQNQTYTWMQHNNNVFTIQGCSGTGETKSTIVLNSEVVSFNIDGSSATNQVFKVNSYDNRFKEGVDLDGRITIYNPKGENTGDRALLDVRGSTQLGTTEAATTCAAYFPQYSSDKKIDFYLPLKVNSQYVEAEYFNATSDARAKENIKPANYSALELIEKLPIYTYNYKNNNETVTGILAQDLLIAQPSNLELVSNINASGENNDYMSIKNDKLMFVLMKAIQEQQEQIKELKSEIENLKKTI